jgi:hypothetical protein
VCSGRKLGKKVRRKERIGNAKGRQILNALRQSDDDLLWKISYFSHQFACVASALKSMDGLQYRPETKLADAFPELVFRV